ncbi:hypothetical protein CATMIT_01177 [Catenibacterium mitsuokai DSM 15897]|nr:hypothetical protein CATMIT_01177 [Catenibacterium mitsuokai DSM 15897]
MNSTILFLKKRVSLMEKSKEQSPTINVQPICISALNKEELNTEIAK